MWSSKCKIWFMVGRPFWRRRIEQAWTKAPIVWLSGVRRVGETTIARALLHAHYLNCDLPSAQEKLRDLELFYEQVRERRAAQGDNTSAPPAPPRAGPCV